MSDWLATIRRRTGTFRPHDWIIELGTGDAFFGNARWARSFKSEISLLSHQECVILVTVNPRLDPPIAEAIDAAITYIANSEPQFHVLDWGSYEWSYRGWVMSDGIHPTATGSAALASLEAAALADDCPSS